MPEHYHQSPSDRGQAVLLDDIRNLTCTYGTATFTDSEFQTLLHRDGLDQHHVQGSIVTRHYHLSTCRQRNFTSHVRSTEIELRTIFVEERRMTATFFLAQYVYFAFEFSVRSDRTGFAKNHTTADLGLFNTAEQQ